MIVAIIVFILSVVLCGLLFASTSYSFYSQANSGRAKEWYNRFGSSRSSSSEGLFRCCITVFIVIVTDVVTVATIDPDRVNAPLRHIALMPIIPNIGLQILFDVILLILALALSHSMALFYLNHQNTWKQNFHFNTRNGIFDRLRKSKSQAYGDSKTLAYIVLMSALVIIVMAYSPFLIEAFKTDNIWNSALIGRDVAFYMWVITLLTLRYTVFRVAMIEVAKIETANESRSRYN